MLKGGQGRARAVPTKVADAEQGGGHAIALPTPTKFAPPFASASPSPATWPRLHRPISSSLMRCAAPARDDCPPRASSGYVDEGGKRRTAVLRGCLDRAPAQIVTEITSSIARGPGVNAGADRGAQKFGGVGPNINALAPPTIDPLRARARSASGNSVVTALRARVSTRHAPCDRRGRTSGGHAGGAGR